MVVQGQYPLAVIAMVASVVAAYLYLRLVVSMYFAGEVGDELAGPTVRVPVGAGLALGVAVIGTLWLGLLPGTITGVANDAVAQLVAFSN